MSSTELHDQLWENAQYLKDGLSKLGFNTGESETPITQSLLEMKKIRKSLVNVLKEGIYVKSIVFPTVPRGTGRVRNMPTAANSY